MRGRYFISGGVKARERANYGVMQGFCVVRCLACACVRYAGRACCVGVARQVSGRVKTDRCKRCKRCKRNSRARILSRAEELRAFFIKKNVFSTHFGIFYREFFVYIVYKWVNALIFV